ncbi:MAG: class I SAM-dependent methyltransferase [Candidatus Rokuibacteriota bacterium]
MRLTHETDPIHFYYRPGIRAIFKKRLEMVLELMGDRRFDELLEVGFGSGIFLKELATRCRRLHGIDVHDNFAFVESMLQKEGVGANLVHSPVEKIAFEGERFDCVVSASVLEHVHDLAPAVDEIARVLKRDGVAILAFPVENLLTDIALWITYIPLNTRLKDEHVSDHRKILAAVRRRFTIVRDLRLPSFLPVDASLYYACACVKR